MLWKVFSVIPDWNRLLPRGSCLQNLVDLSQLAQGSKSIKIFLQRVSESHCQQEILWLFDLFTSTFSYPSLMTAIYWQWGLWSEHRWINCHTNWHPQFYSSDDGSWHQLTYVNERRQHGVEIYHDGLQSPWTQTWGVHNWWGKDVRARWISITRSFFILIYVLFCQSLRELLVSMMQCYPTQYPPQTKCTTASGALLLQTLFPKKGQF